MTKKYRKEPNSHKISAIALALLMASFAPALFLQAPAALAATEPAYCSTLGGTWDGLTTCTSSGNHNLSFGTLEVTSGTTLVITNSAGNGITVEDGATLLVDSGAAVTIESVGTQATGIYVDGVVTNSGTITIENSGTGSVGIFTDFLLFTGTLTNTGTIIVENTGGYGIYNYYITYNSGTITVENSGGIGMRNEGTFHNSGTVDNYGTVENPGTLSQSPLATFNEECGAVFTGSAVTQGFYNQLACGPVFLGMQSTLSGIVSSLSDISTSLSDGFSSLSTAISDLSNQVSDLSNSLSNDFDMLSSAIAEIGSSGPLAGTSEGTTVDSASLKAVSASSSLSASPSDWTQIANASSNEVVTGFTVSATKGSITQGVLYITFTNDQCGCTAQTFAIPIGDLPKGVTPLGGVTSPHFSVPAGSTVYVQLVSGTKAGADIQLQFAQLPISGPTIVTTTTTT
jgi:hypothetical protein